MQIIVKPNESIEQAISKANPGDSILIKSGIYNEKIKITNNNITIKGEDNVIIQNKDYSPKTHIDNKEYNTFRTYTVMVTGENVTIENVTIKNLSTPCYIYGQAVALHVLGDDFKLSNSKLISAQDTLFCGPLPPNLQIKYIGFLPEDELTPMYSHQLYENCYIEGDIDFIFGGGISVFKDCHFHQCSDTPGYFFAPSHNKDQEYGFTCFNCLFTGNEDSMYLARPWRDYGKVTLIDCEIKNNVIKKDGWNKWNNTNRDKTARFEEYNTKGQDTSSYLSFGKHLTKDEALKYDINIILNK